MSLTTEVFDFCSFKLTFLQFKVQVVVGQDAKNIIDYPSMQDSVVWSVDKNVVHVDRDISFVDEVAENEIHHGLKSGQGVCESEKHNHWFEQAAICFEGCFPLVSIANAYVIVSPSDIQLREECQSATMHSRESIHQLLYQWQWGGVSHSEHVEFAIVLHWTKVSVLLFNEEKWERVWGF